MVTSVTMILLLQTILYLNVKSEIINCDQSNYCDCNNNPSAADTYACYEDTIVCNAGSDCNIDCGHQGCQRATIQCPNGYECNIYCHKFYACSESIIHGNNASSLSIYGNDTTSTHHIYDANINCPNGPSKCSINCGNQYANCNKAEINGENTDSLSVKCGSDNAAICKEVNIYCPISGSCNIAGQPSTQTMRQVNIFALHGFNSVTITGTSSVDSIGTMYCKDSYTTSCAIDGNNINSCNPSAIDKSCDASPNTSPTIAPTTDNKPTTNSPTTYSPTNSGNEGRNDETTSNDNIQKTNGNFLVNDSEDNLWIYVLIAMFVLLALLICVFSIHVFVKNNTHTKIPSISKLDSAGDNQTFACDITNEILNEIETFSEHSQQTAVENDIEHEMNQNIHMNSKQDQNDQLPFNNPFIGDIYTRTISTDMFGSMKMDENEFNENILYDDDDGNDGVTTTGNTNNTCVFDDENRIKNAKHRKIFSEGPKIFRIESNETVYSEGDYNETIIGNNKNIYENNDIMPTIVENDSYQTNSHLRTNTDDIDDV